MRWGGIEHSSTQDRPHEDSIPHIWGHADTARVWIGFGIDQVPNLISDCLGRSAGLLYIINTYK